MTVPYDPDVFLRDTTILGDPGSPAHKVVKAQLRQYLKWMGREGATVVAGSKAELNALQGASQNAKAEVRGASNRSENGIYKWSGSRWLRLVGHEASFALLVEISGTQNEITASTVGSVETGEVKAFLGVSPFNNQSGGTYITIDGLRRQILDAKGDPLEAGFLMENRAFMLHVADDGTLRCYFSGDALTAAYEARESAHAADIARQAAEAAAVSRLKDTYGSRAALGSSTVDPAVRILRLTGYNYPGDGGALYFVECAEEPSAHAEGVQDASGRWFEPMPGQTLDIRQFGAKPNTGDDQTPAIHRALDYAKAVNAGNVRGSGRYSLRTPLRLRSGVALSGDNKFALQLQLYAGSYITNEMNWGSLPLCEHSGLTASIFPGDGQTDVPVDLAGAEYSEFDLYISGDFDGRPHSFHTGVRLTSIYDEIAGRWRYARNNRFEDPRIYNCANGVITTKHPDDPATFGASFNRFYAGYASGYKHVGVYVQYGERNLFYSTRCTTSHGNGSIGWRIADAKTFLSGCTADGSFGGNVVPDVNEWGIQLGRDGDTSTVGFLFEAGSSGSVLLSHAADGCYQRITFDSLDTFRNVVIISGRNEFHVGEVRATDIIAGGYNASRAPLRVVKHHERGLSALFEAQTPNTSTNFKVMQLSNGTAQILPGINKEGDKANLDLGVGEEPQWRVQEGAFVPIGGDNPNIGTGGSRINRVYALNAEDISSDVRRKEELEEIAPDEVMAAQLIKQLIKRYKLKSENSNGDGRWHYGVLAHEVIAALEEHNIDYRSIGWINEDPEDGYFSIAYTELIMLLIKAS
ncbi:tail fiber domain-containing protein [Pseudovibrio exalbescens]|uniref:tail fiber domain-containing protein n=1 Tax=Pseudovibrio exalbescens TaxID=197461 RepID=UPI000C99E502|nr:tail fiber domain-containing protein [Pseudovibrio exalbescens]